MKKTKEQNNTDCKNYQHRLRRRVIDKLGGACAHCRNNDWRVLQLDHVNGGGTHMRLRTGGQTWARFYLEILADAHDQPIQILCANCNLIKKHVNKEFGAYVPKDVSVT